LSSTDPHNSDKALSIIYGTDNYVYAAGYSYDSSTFKDFTVISLEPEFSITEKSVSAIRVSNNTQTIITGLLLLPEDRKCRIFDITGRSVAPSRMKPGVYFIEIDGQIKRKVIKIR